MEYRKDRPRAVRRYRPTISDALEGRDLPSTLAAPPRTHHAAHAAIHAKAVEATEAQNPPMVSTDAAPNVTIRQGYHLSLLSTGLNYPDSITFGPKGKIWVSEAAFSPNDLPKIRQINPDGSATTILSADQLPPGTLAGPLTDVTYHQG